MSSEDIYQRIVLSSQSIQGLCALDCVSWRDAGGGYAFRAIFKTGTPVEVFDFENTPPDVAVSKVLSVNTGLVVFGTSRSKDIILTTVQGPISLSSAPAEWSAFEGMNVIIAERNGETVEAISQWLRYHIKHFSLQGVLLIDRDLERNIKPVERDLKVVCEELGLKRFVHISWDVPLGQDAPSARHPFNAPDAPGKDRMGELPQDSQLAPLAELTLFEWARWRFLAKARAVANIDVLDLIQPGDNPFDTVQESSAGTLQMLGQRIYPWRVRPGDNVQFGDHICRQFDNPRANRRWVLAPARLVEDTVWRYVRIVKAEPQEHETKGFWRAMGLRHPQCTPAEIAPKTSLIEDDDLIALSETVFVHKPVRAPESTMKRAPKAAIDAGRTCIVTCMKNEGPFILEWIAYHRAIGVDDFLIYTNDCSDGTDELLDLLADRGIVVRRDNKFKNSDLKPQHWALAAAENEEIVKNCGWAISMDVDEFINIHIGEGKLDDLYQAIGDKNMISLTWRLFGNADVHGYEDVFLIDQFDRCAPELCRKPHQAWGFKTLFRNIGIYKKMGVHRPKGLKPDLWDQIKWVNGSGQPMPRKLLRNGWRSTTDSYGYDLVTLNHYAVRSAESFLVKRDRGRVNHVDRDQGLSYWFRMNNNAEQDRSIQNKRPLLQAEFDRLMADQELHAAHMACVEAHRRKIDELLETENYTNFYKDLTGPRLERLSRMHTHFGSNVFLAGPDSIPDEISEMDEVPNRFFFTVPKADTTH